MEENKEIINEEKNPESPKKQKAFLRPSKPVALIAYVVLLFFLGSGIMYIIAGIISSTRGLDFNTLIKTLSDSNPSQFGTDYVSASYFVQGISNFITYLIAFAVVVFYTRDLIVTDFKDLINRRTKLGWMIPLMAVAFTGIAFLIDLFVSQAVKSSNNQNTIVQILKTGSAPFMIICTVLFAPVVEELVYRKCIFSMLKDRLGLVWCYILSTVLFALPHMISTPLVNGNVGIWLLQSLPYFLSGALLCLVYHLSKFNIYATITAHILNNVLAVFLVYGGFNA